MAGTEEAEAQSAQNLGQGVAVKIESSMDGNENPNTSSKIETFSPKKRNRSYSQEPEATESKRQKGVAPIKAEYVLIPTHLLDTHSEYVQVSASIVLQQSRGEGGR
jgi:hypothetical protein